SGGKLSSFGFHEKHDVAAILDLIERRWPDQPRALLGISMGAAAICFAAEQASKCQAIILESCYRDVFTAFANRLQRYPDWMKQLSAGTVKVTERRLQLQVQEVNPALHIDKLTPAPVLLLTGTKDRFAPPEEAQSLYEKCSEPREIFLVEGADHHDVFETGAAAYRDRVVDFLQRHMQAALAGGFRAA
ncbi:MAG: alpha/beta hydrolase, partial [Gemmataceae bacterium]